MPCTGSNSTFIASTGTTYTVQTLASAYSSACIAARPDCQRASENYGIVAGVTFGSAPLDVQHWWTANHCGTSPTGTTSSNYCQKASETFGIVANVTFGYAPQEVKTWWSAPANSCFTSPLTATTLCQRASDSYRIVPDRQGGPHRRRGARRPPTSASSGTQATAMPR